MNLLHILMWVFGALLVIAFFLWATQLIEEWIEDQPDDGGPWG